MFTSIPGKGALEEVRSCAITGFRGSECERSGRRRPSGGVTSERGKSESAVSRESRGRWGNQKEMAMRRLFTEYDLSIHFRELEAIDRKLERRGWFRRHENHSPHTRWRFRAGEALIRLGRRLQGRREAEGLAVSVKL